MDFHNICSHIDVDAIRAKLPPLPEMFTQFKLPKSIAKLKSRKIFGSSRENIHDDEQRSGSKRSAKREMPSETSSAGFIDHTPNKISTISSLVDKRRAGGGRRVGSTNRGDEGFYRNAGGIDDYCPSPENLSKSRGSITHMSPRGERSANTEEVGRRSFVDRVQKSYKDASEFRLKHMFIKKTVVRQDGIKVDDYVERYAEDRRLEERYEEQREQAMADNYNFHFKTSRRKSEESFGISTPSDSPSNTLVSNKKQKKKPLSEQSGDESGMEQSPPPRKPGIASTRFSRVRKEPLNMSLEEDDGIVKLSLDDSDEDDEEIPLRPPPVPAAKATRQKSEETNALTARRQKSQEQEIVRRQKSQDHEMEDDDDDMEEIEEIEEIDVAEIAKPNLPKSKKTKTPSSPKKRQAPVLPQRSTDNSELDMSSPARRNSSSSEAQHSKTLGNIKGNFKRLQKSMKLGASSTAAQSGTESDAEDAGKKTKSQQFTERLKRFRSVDNVDKQTEGDEPDKSLDSPMHRLNNKLQDWKKSFKKKPDSQRPDAAAEDDDEPTSPKKLGKAQQSLMRKLKQIRSRKRPTGDDPDEDEEGGATYREDFRARARLQLEKGVAAASQMPQITLEKIKETKKYFRKTQEKSTEPKQETKKEVKPKVTNHDSDESNLDDDEEEEVEVKSRAAPAVKSATAKPPVKQHYYTSDEEEHDQEEEEDEEDQYDRRQQQLAQQQSLEPYQQKVLVPMARAAWTTKPIHSDSMDTGDDDDDDVLPRVLIHQDNSDVFESTLIIAVTRPMPRSHSPSAFITELPPDSPKASTAETKADHWVPHQQMISTVVVNSEPLRRELSRDTIASISSKGHSRKHSMDSSSEDSWIKDVPRGPSIAIGLNSVTETEESWKVQAGKNDEALYKTKSIDIFEKSGGMKIFDDFDDELKNTPIVKIERQVETKVIDIREKSNNESFERDSSEELDNADDDNSSRVTKILKQPEEVQKQIQPPPRPPPIKSRDDIINVHAQYGNSAESLMENAEALKINQAEKDKADSDSDEEDNDSDSDEEYNRPPSATPSPPPAVTPTPPPLPARQPSIRLSKLPKVPSTPPEELPPSPPRAVPPLPKTKPPVAPNRPAPQPPKIPERTPSMSRVARPLVKTSSLRLSFDEQVNPEDVGKVNKLISRFEPNGGFSERPRLIPKRLYMSQSPEDYSEDEEEEVSSETESKKVDEINANVKTILMRERSLDITPTNKPKIEKSYSIDSVALPVTPTNIINNNNNNNVLPIQEETPTEVRKLAKTKKPPAPTIIEAPPPPPPTEEEVVTPKIPSISISSTAPQIDANSNFSQPNSEYGSPMAYPSSLVGSAQATPQSIRKDTDLLQTRRSRRSMTRDPERFYSFDSDEEDSYYSIGSAGNNRYVVDL